MGCDNFSFTGQKTITGNNVSISVNTNNKEEAAKLFNGLSAVGKVTMPMAATFWCSYFGMLTDKFGILSCPEIG
jgi:PhnB protein